MFHRVADALVIGSRIATYGAVYAVLCLACFEAFRPVVIG